MLCVCTLSGIAVRLCQVTNKSFFLVIECEYRKILVVRQIDTGIEDKREYTYIILVNGLIGYSQFTVFKLRHFFLFAQMNWSIIRLLRVYHRLQMNDEFMLCQ